MYSYSVQKEFIIATGKKMGNRLLGYTTGIRNWEFDLNFIFERQHYEEIVMTSITMWGLVWVETVNIMSGGLHWKRSAQCEFCSYSICCRSKASHEKLWVGLSQYLPAACWLLGNGPAFTSIKPGGSPYTCICFIFKIVQKCFPQPSLIVRLDK